MINYTTFVLVLLLVLIFAVLFLATSTWGNVFSVSEICNNSVPGLARFLGGPEGNVLVSYAYVNGTLVSNVYLVDTQCNVMNILLNHRGIVTNLVLIESFNKSLLAIASYNASSGGAVGDITVYDTRSDSMIWRLGSLRLRNVTLTRIGEPGFIFAGIDSSNNIVVAKIVVVNNGLMYYWNKTFNAIMYPQENNVFLVYDDISNTVLAGAGRTLTILDYNNGSILFRVQDIGGIIEKIHGFWDGYIVLAGSKGAKKVILLYRDDGNWSYDIIYMGANITDLYPVIDSRLIAVAEGQAPNKTYAVNNTNSSLVIIDDKGDIMDRINIKGTLIRVNGYIYSENKQELYVLVDYMYVNGSKITYYSGLASTSSHEIPWRHVSFKPLRSFILGNHIYVIEYYDEESVIHGYRVIALSS